MGVVKVVIVVVEVVTIVVVALIAFWDLLGLVSCGSEGPLKHILKTTYLSSTRGKGRPAAIRTSN